MAAPQENNDGPASWSREAWERVARDREARERATEEEIEEVGIRPDAERIVCHMNEDISNRPSKRARIDDSTARRVYQDSHGNGPDHDGQDNHNQTRKSDENFDEDAFEKQWQALLKEKKLQNTDPKLLQEFRNIARQRAGLIARGIAAYDAAHPPPAPPRRRFDLIGSLSSCNELIVEVCKHVKPRDILRLYSISKDFHIAVNKDMRSSVLAWAKFMAPSSTRIYSCPIYYSWFVEDPTGRPPTQEDWLLYVPRPGQARGPPIPLVSLVPSNVRIVPGLKWLQMVVAREIRVRDILATLARMGHRTPEGAHLTLKKLWVIMDAATSSARMRLINNPDFFTDEDLYIAQLFMVKLVLAFNDPIFGPQSTCLMRLMLGQRSLSPLWALLRGKKYRSEGEIEKLKLRYDVGPEDVMGRQNLQLHGLQPHELGTGHLEGWGRGGAHLLRPDELVPAEAARRQLHLDSCIHEMIIYGHVDLSTGNSLVPSVEEMYMSDDEELPRHLRDWTPLRFEPINGGCGNVPFEKTMWKPKHARKARWKTLTGEEKAMIVKEEELEMKEVDQLNQEWDSLDAEATALAEMAKGYKEPYFLAPPNPEDLKEQLDALEAEMSEAMDVDSATPSGMFNLPQRMAQMMVDHAPTGSGQAEQQNRSEQDEDSQSTSSNSLAGLSDTGLDLVPIPARDLERLFRTVGRREAERPQDEEDTSSEEDANSENSLLSEIDESQFKSEEEEAQWRPSPPRQLEARPQVFHFDSSSNTPGEPFVVHLPPEIALTHTPPPPRANNTNNTTTGNPPTSGRLTREQLRNMTLDERLIAQADEDYSSSSDGNPDALREDHPAFEVDESHVSRRAHARDIDWDEFLRNPTAYTFQVLDENQLGGGNGPAAAAAAPAPAPAPAVNHAAQGFNNGAFPAPPPGFNQPAFNPINAPPPASFQPPPPGHPPPAGFAPAGFAPAGPPAFQPPPPGFAPAGFAPAGNGNGHPVAPTPVMGPIPVNVHPNFFAAAGWNPPAAGGGQQQFDDDAEDDDDDAEGEEADDEEEEDVDESEEEEAIELNDSDEEEDWDNGGLVRVTGQEDESVSYTVNEDLYEDHKTRRARDWFRPW